MKHIDGGFVSGLVKGDSERSTVFLVYIVYPLGSYCACK